MQPFFMLSCNALPEALQTATCIHLLHRHRYCHCRHRRYHFKLLGFSPALKKLSSWSLHLSSIYTQVL